MQRPRLPSWHSNLVRGRVRRRIVPGMNRYKATTKLGDGTYGVVLKAVNRSSGEVVRAACAAGDRTRASVTAPRPRRWRSRR